MEWNERYRDQEFSILSALKKGRPLPKWVEEEPFLEPGECALLDAYSDLLTCRTLDGVIPWSVMIEYADRQGYDTDVAQAFVRIVRYLDTERLRRERVKKGKAEAPPTESEAEAQGDALAAGMRLQPASQEQMYLAAKARMQAAKEKAARKGTK